MRKCWIVIILALLSYSFTFAQDKGIFKEYKNAYWDKIEKEVNRFESKKTEEKKHFSVDFSKQKFPTDRSKYQIYWHFPPTSQGNTGTCWAFSTTSFFESEIYRLTKKKIKLSEMYTVYWETVEKARRFVKERGNSLFDEGSEGNAIERIWKKYGIVRAEDYIAKKTGQKYHSHEKMFKEMKAYLQYVKKHNIWNEDQVLSTIKSIMNHYIGSPPQYIKVRGRKITPKEYLKMLGLDLDDYVDLLSLMQEPFYSMAEYKVPDNWWHSKGYFNVPLKDFMSIMKYAVRNGFTVLLGGDISEAGYDCNKEVALIPSFDIPFQYIDDNARQFRFSNGTTEDDHGIHCVGWMEKDGMDWYLIKDSGSGSHNGKNFGYTFYREDYVKLKMMNIMVHKDAAKLIWERFVKARRHTHQK